MNKKLVVIGMVGMLIFGIGVGVHAASDIRLFIHGKQVDADIQIINGTSYVPLRTVSESLGADVKWDEVNRTINIKKTKTYDVTNVIWSGPLMMKISKITLDTAYQNDKTASPINAIIFDVSIENITSAKKKWYPKKGKVRVNYDEIAEISSPIDYSDDLDGSFAGQQVKKGKMIVKVNSNIEDIKTIEFLLDGSTDGESFEIVQASPIELK